MIACIKSCRIIKEWWLIKRVNEPRSNKRGEIISPSCFLTVELSNCVKKEDDWREMDDEQWDKMG